MQVPTKEEKKVCIWLVAGFGDRAIWHFERELQDSGPRRCWSLETPHIYEATVTPAPSNGSEKYFANSERDKLL
jgi:hypothetical protein